MIHQQESAQWYVDFATLCLGHLGDMARELARMGTRFG